MQWWESLIDGFGVVLRAMHDAILPFAGDWAWAWSIVMLTVAVRILLIPLMVKQINSMRGMQELQPELKKLQDKYKTDRSMMRTDPEKFRQRRQKQQEEMMKLYKERKVNPAMGCLPLLAQAPIFIALFMLLRDQERTPELADAGFILIDSLAATPAQGAGPGSFVLMALMGITMYLTMHQMQARSPQAASQMPQQQQIQKIMLYVMPVMLTVFAYNFPVGVVLYWVTTNLWTMGQQWVMLRNVQPAGDR